MKAGESGVRGGGAVYVVMTCYVLRVVQSIEK
jgi:hypothetical protein